MATDQRVPTGDGYTTASVDIVPSSPTTRYDKVDDPVGSPDDATTYVIGLTTGYVLFTFSAFSVPTGSTGITLRIYYRHKDDTTGANNIRAALQVGGSYYTVDTGVNPGASWVTTTYTYTVNPKSAAAWTVDDINGVGTNALQQFGIVFGDASPPVDCTQVYAEVVYTPGGGNTYNESIAMAAVGATTPDPAGSIYNPETVMAALATMTGLSQADFLDSIILPAIAAKAASGGMSFDDSAFLAVVAGVASGGVLGVNVDASLIARSALDALSTALMDAGVALAGKAGIEVLASANLQGAFNLAILAGLAADGEIPGQTFYETITMAVKSGTTTDALTIFNTLADLLAKASTTADAVTTFNAPADLLAKAALTSGTSAILEAAVIMLAAALLSADGEIPGEEIAEVFIEILRRRRGCR